MDLQLLVGLGNPGSRYVGTRHNVGFMVLERLAARKGIAFRSQSRLHGLLSDLGTASSRLRLLMPQTFMNDSGRSIRAALDWFSIRPDQLLVVVDDMDLPLGRLRLRRKGSAGGHNGLRSAISHLGTEDFARLRIGIGAPVPTSNDRRARTVDHVLGRFSPSERSTLEAVLAEVETGIGLIQRMGLERAGNHLNGFRAEIPSG